MFRASNRLSMYNSMNQRPEETITCNVIIYIVTPVEKHKTGTIRKLENTTEAEKKYSI